MILAIEQLRAHADASLYSELFFAQKIKFIYPLSSLTWLDLLQLRTGWDWDHVVDTINKACWICLPAIALTCVALLWDAAAKFETVPTHRRQAYLLAVLLLSVVATCLFYPLTLSFAAGQIQTPISLLVALALLAWQRGYRAVAGALLGLCCGIKPQWLAILPWALLRRQWKMAGALLASAALLHLAAAYRYGVGNTGGYLSVLSYLSQHGEGYLANQSINGLLNRLVFDRVGADFDIHDYPPFNRMVYLGSLLNSVALLGAAILWQRKAAPSEAGLALMILSLTMASPIAWEHHYGILLPISFMLLPRIIVMQPFGERSLLLLATAFLLFCQSFNGLTNPLSGSLLNVFQSYLLLGAGLMLWLLYRIVGQESAPPASVRDDLRLAT